MNLIPENTVQVVVSTHAGRQPITRLSVFRLRRAVLARDEAIQLAHDRYREEVRAIYGTDREVAKRQSCNAPVPALRPFAHALEWLGRFAATDPRELFGARK